MNLTDERAKRERNALRISLLEALGVALTLASLTALLSGCAALPYEAPSSQAAQRFLTEQQDAEMRKLCVQGCQVIPNPIWNRIEQILRALSGEERGT